jgi:alpha-L-fucosidase
MLIPEVVYSDRTDGTRRVPHTETTAHGVCRTLVVLLAIGWFAAAGGRAEEPAADKETDPAVLANIERFKDWKFGLFIHWGPCTQWGAQIAWALSPSQTWARADDLPAWVERNRNFEVFSRDFFDLNKTFNPEHFDPDAWAKAAAEAGMKYVVFVTKCHDGFALFDTKQSHYSITDPSCPFHTNPRANVTKEVLDAFRRQKLGVGLYFSMPDWHHPDYEDPSLPPLRLFSPNYDIVKQPEKWQRYLKFFRGQVEELTSNHGPIDILWLDGGAGEGWEMDKLAAIARRRQPGMLIVHRGGGGRYENYRTPEQQIPGKALPYAWETCLTMGDYWAYSPKDYYKPARELIHLIVEIVCKGGNLLLDIGPDADGRLPPESLARLREIGDWMKVNGEAICGTRPVAPYREGRVCLTRKGDAVYLIHLANLAQVRPPATIAVSNIQPAAGAEVTLLGKGLRLQWEKRGNGMLVHIPANISCPLRGEHPYCRHAWVVKISKAAADGTNGI